MTPAQPPRSRPLWILVSLLALFGSGLSLMREPIVRWLRTHPVAAVAADPARPGGAVDFLLPDPAGVFGLDLRVRFRMPPPDRPGVLIQTSPAAAGLTLEAVDGSLAITLPGGHGEPMIGVFGAGLDPTEWHDLRLSGRFDSEVTVRLDNRSVFTAPFVRAAFENGRLRVGGDIGGARPFAGAIATASLAELGPWTAAWYYTGGRLILTGLMVVAILRMRHASAVTPMTPPPPRNRDIDYLLVIRGIAAGIVLLGHVTLVVFPARTLPADASALYRLLAPYPWVGVWIFFTLSGYLMGKGFYTGRYRLESGRIAAFYRNRALRIAPLFFAAVLLVAALKAREIFRPARLWNLADILSFDYGGSLPINPIGALWSVSTEVQFYLLVPLLAWALFSRPIRQWKIPLALPLAVAGAGLAGRWFALHWLGTQGWYTYVYTPALSNLDLFAVGMLLNPLCDRFRGRLPVGGTTKFLVFVAVAVIGYALLARFTLSAMIAPKLSALFAMVGVGATVTAAFAGGLIFVAEAMTAAGRESPALRRATALPSAVGLISYSLYVWHEPIILGLRPWFPTSLSEFQTYEALLTCIGAVTLTATVSYFLIERPFERLKFSPPGRPLAAWPVQSIKSADREPIP